MEGVLIAWAQGVACSNHAAPTNNLNINPAIWGTISPEASPRIHISRAPTEIWVNTQLIPLLDIVAATLMDNEP